VGACTEVTPAETAAIGPPTVVYHGPSLAVPPNYTLHPREPGRQILDDRTIARRILGRRWSSARTNANEPSQANAPETAEAALRRELGLSQALPDIRELLARDAGASVVQEGYPVHRLLCWPGTPSEFGCLAKAEPNTETDPPRSVQRERTPQIAREDEGLTALF
jgi:hypothetical protein